jgi:hypothetical protein
MMISCVDFGRTQPGVQNLFRGGNAAPAESPENARRLSPIAVAPSRLLGAKRRILQMVQ